MPNWAYTQIDIKGKDAAKMREEVESWILLNAEDNGFGTKWLGNVVVNSGLVNSTEDPKCPRCRGQIIDICDNGKDGEFSITEETAWFPMFQMWIDLI